MQILEDVIYQVVDDFNRTLPEARRLPKSPTVVLLDTGTHLDSIEISAFLIAVEEFLIEQEGVELSLISNTVVEDPTKPLSNLGTLAKYIEKLVASSR